MENIITINSDLRTLEIPAGIKNLGVEYDDDVRRLHFRMPKMYDGTDLSGFAVRINYMNANNDGDVYLVTDKAVEDEYITFSWLVGRLATAYKGNVRFIVCLKESDAAGEVLREFNTTPASLPVLEGLEAADAIEQKYPDVLESILARLDVLDHAWNSCGLPQLLLYGDTSAMTKDNAVALDYVYGDKSGTCTVKWQGTSSIAFPKKNYTIKFDNAFEAYEGWGIQNKYCLKANWVDFSHARNIVSAKLWGQVVKTRHSTKNIFSPNYVGFVDGVQSVNGLTVTANADGSLTVMGTATAWTHITVQHELYAGSTNILTNGLNTDNYNDEYCISVVNSNGEYPAGLEWFGYDSNTHMAFIRVNVGDSINDTIYPQIEKGKSATLWDAPLSTNTQKLSALVNGGGVDGFPIVVAINGTYQGIYTFNIPKDGWMFDMGSGTQEGIVCAEAGPYLGASYLREQAVCDGTDFSIEYAADEDNTAWIPTSVNRLINALNNSDGTDLDTTIAQYLDWDSAIDYFAMSLLFNNFDGYGKNYLLATYDGIKWLFSAYDMDSTHGLWWNGQEFMSATSHPSGLVSSFRQNKVFDMICLYKKAELMARYTELRNSVLSEDNVITTFGNFISRIPKGLYDRETTLWVDIPSTSVNNFAQIADFYKRRSAFIDREIENL